MTPRRLTLIGIKHCGKSTLGKALAAELNWRFLDADALLAERHHLAVRDLFRRVGETRFRELEAELIGELAGKDLPDTVLALGGGAADNRFIPPTVWEQLQPVLMLDVADATAERRTFADGIPAYLSSAADPAAELRRINAGRREVMRKIARAEFRLADEADIAETVRDLKTFLRAGNYL